MGFDIIGVKPAKDVGECFTANVHTWTAVWRFICDNCGDLLTPKQVKEGFANDGIAINARQTRCIVERLNGIIASGKSVKSDGSQSHPRETAKLNLLKLQSIIGADSSADDSENSISALAEFIEFARYSGGFKIF